LTSGTLGRDLLDLGDAHISAPRFTALALARAIELIADGEHARAAPRALRCETSDTAAIAACRSRKPAPQAVEPLGRGSRSNPWPLHHWNLAVALHALGDAAGTYHALRRFLATSARPTALHGDPDQLARIAFAETRLVELERAARLTGTALKRSNRRRAKRSTPSRA
jgi:hypothetical protein